MYDVDPSRLSTADSRESLLGRAVPDVPWGMLAMTSVGRSFSGLAPAPLEGGEPAVRRDLRPLAFWLGALDTDADGVAEVAPALPEALTTYRVFAVAPTAPGSAGDVPLVATSPDAAPVAAALPDPRRSRHHPDRRDQPAGRRDARAPVDREPDAGSAGHRW